MTLEEIKAAVRAGKKVHWSNDIYEVRLTPARGFCKEQWLIVCTANNHCIGLTHTDEITMNGKEEEFYEAKN